MPNINSSYIKQCNFDFESNMYCPIFKVGDVIRFAQQDFTTLAKKVSVIVIFSFFCGGGGGGGGGEFPPLLSYCYLFIFVSVTLLLYNNSITHLIITVL